MYRALPLPISTLEAQYCPNDDDCDTIARQVASSAHPVTCRRRAIWLRPDVIPDQKAVRMEMRESVTSAQRHRPLLGQQRPAQASHSPPSPGAPERIKGHSHPRPQQLADFAIKAHLSTMHGFGFYPDAGGLMSYGATQSEIYTMAADQVA